MISYLRNTANGNEKLYPIGRHTNQDYGMTEYIYPTKLTAMCRSMNSVGMLGSKKMNEKEYILLRSCFAWTQMGIVGGV